MKFIDILIADDHELFRRNLRYLVESQPGWRVCAEAADGMEALQKAKDQRPHIVLIDMSMPRMDGAEAARRIRREVPESHVIMVSQNDPALMRKIAAETGAHAFISKSDIVRELIPAVLKITNGNHHYADSILERKQEPARNDWLFGGGTLASRIWEYDWSKTPLGSIQNWSQSLRTAVNLMLNSQHPMWIGWGQEITFLYNDAYIPVLSLAKHPWALGRPASEVWAEIWDVCGPLANKVFSRGEPSFVDDVRLFMNRGDYLEETYYSFSYSPIYDESGKVAGLFCPSTEITSKALNARRLKTLSDLSAKSMTEKSAHAAAASCVETISANPDDIPFALLYLVDANQNSATLEGASRIARGQISISPLTIKLDDESQSLLWPVREMIERPQTQVISLENVNPVPVGLANQEVRQALVLPVTSLGMEHPIGVLVAGVNPTRKLDADYRTFFSLVADQVATSIQNATALQREKERADALAEVDRAKTMFFSNVSHEFRTPLTLMLGPLEDMLAESEGLVPRQRERVDVAHRNSLRLLKLVNALLDFSRIEAGRIQASYAPTNLGKLTADLASVFRSAIERAGIRFTVDCEPITDLVYVDTEMWEKIVFNLLSNAFKFTFTGEIAISLRQRGHFVELAVRDSGIGIPASELPHLFERFYRVKGAQGRTFEGSGIGLALVQELAKLHGGTVTVESEPNRGSTFVVSTPLGKDHLPADRINATRDQTSTSLNAEPFLEEAFHWLPDSPAALPAGSIDNAAAAPSPTVFASGEQRRSLILLADDNADMRRYVQRLLGKEYQVVVVSDGEAALKSAQTQKPDLILSDVMMPHLDGFGLLQRLRADDSLKSVPVILLSARAGEESRIEGLQSGADDYLVKPFSARELLARVRSHLALAEVRKDSAELGNKLRLHSELLASIVASSDDAIVSKNLDGIITSWNPAAERIFGYTAAEAIGRHITLIIPSDRRDEEIAIIDRVRRGERTDHFDTVRVRKDGTLLNISVTVSPVHDASGKIIGASKVARDITAQKQSDEREKRSIVESIAANAKFRAVFEQTSVFAGIMTKDGVLIEANKLCLEACGYSADEVLGKPFWQTRWWRDFKESEDKIRLATARAAQGIPYREILNYSWADGTERIVDFGLYPILDDKGEVIYLHPTGVDLTDLKNAEENYRNLAETLEAEVHSRTAELESRKLEVTRQAELLREFSQQLLQAQDEERRRIARELHDSAGQTLTVLSLTLSQLHKDISERVPEQASQLEMAQQAVQQLHSEIRTTSYLLHPPLLDETGLASALNWYVQGLIERSELEISLDISQNLGRLDRALELAIFRLVQESLTNIHRHSGSNTASIRIDRVSERITINISDRGKGMSPQRLAEIQSGASGLGIRGMRERLRQFGATFEIESGAAGTQIHVAIPLPKDGPATEEARSQTESINRQLAAS